MTRNPRSQPPEPSRPLRAGLWVLCALALAGLVAALAKAFPDPRRDAQDWWSVAYLGGLLVLITAGLFRSGRVFRPRHLRYLAIWSAIAALIALAYAYRAELGFSDPAPRPAQGERTI